jgi:protein tyrosine phosphatase (PTP) superfamily phosphohydrolase (DUF442 family)
MTNLDDIRDFQQLTSDVATSGQPALNQFQMIADAGYEAVINLAAGGDSPDDEPKTWRALGLDYLHIPVVWTRPTLDDLSRFFAAMRQHEGKKIYVHCVANKRVSAFMYLYRVTQLGMPEPDARRDLNVQWQPNLVWQTFIDEAMRRCGITSR